MFELKQQYVGIFANGTFARKHANSEGDLPLIYLSHTADLQDAFVADEKLWNTINSSNIEVINNSFIDNPRKQLRLARALSPVILLPCRYITKAHMDGSVVLNKRRTIELIHRSHAIKKEMKQNDNA